MTFKFGKRSKDNLRGVHPDLVKVMEKAIAVTDVDFVIIEGLRSRARQMALVKAGASKTMNSRHLTGHAVDLAPCVGGKIRFDWPLYHKLAPVIKLAAVQLGIPIVWGGDWSSFKDGPHFELDRKQYP